LPARRATRVHAIVGPDSFLAEEALAAILATAVGADRGEAVQTLRGDENTWSRVLDAARTRSLFASRRVVVVRNAEALKGPEEGLAEYLEDPNPDVGLVFMAGRPDKRRTAWKTLLAGAETISAEPLKGARLRSRVNEELRRRQLPLDPDAGNELVERVGQDLRRLMGELDKLEAFAVGHKRLSAQDVAAVLGRGFARPFWLLGDAVAERRTGQALELVASLLDDGEEAPMLLGAVYQSLRRVRGLRALREARASREDKLAWLPKTMAFKLPDLERAAERWSEAELVRAQAALRKADRRVKTGASAAVALAAAILEACSKKTGARPSPPAR